jgi:GNAT superfamily N-acetyltransferase
MRIEPDFWLKSIFGHDVFRCTGSGHEPVRQNEIDSAIQSNREAFFYAKVPVGALGALRTFLNAGFQIADINITLERKPETIKNQEITCYTIRDAHREDCEAVTDIAGVCFTNSRFHKDPHIPEEIANRIKRKWVENYFKGERGERIIVADRDGKPAGFLAIAKIQVNDQTVRIIDLIGVHPSIQGTGAGKQMVQYFITSSVGECDLLRVGTQIINLPSLHLYEKSGFSISDSAYVLHAHVRNGRVIP